MNSFVRFLGELLAWKKHFEFVWPLPNCRKLCFQNYRGFFLADLWFFHSTNIIKFLTDLNEVGVKEIVGASCCWCGYSVILFSMLFVPFGRGRIMYAFIIIREEYSMLIFPRVSFSITQGFFSSWETSSRKAIEGFPSSFHNLIFNFPPLLQKANSLWLKVSNSVVLATKLLEEFAQVFLSNSYSSN